MRAKLPVFILALCALLSFSAHADPVIGQAAPAFVATTLDGKTVDLSTLKGKVFVVHFWATWCAPCREEMPALEAVYRQYHGKGLEVIAVSADRPRARDDVLQVMHYFTFPTAMLNDLSKNDFGRPTSIPITYVVGKDGNLSGILTPDTQPLTETGLGDMVKGLLDAKADAPKPPTADAPPATDKK